MTRVAYLVSEYPAVSHTFIRREIAALRRLGLEIAPFSVRPPRIESAERVVSIQGLPMPRALTLALRAMTGAPFRFFATWLLAQRHRAAGLKGWIWAQFHFVEAVILASMLKDAGSQRLHCHFANSGSIVGMLAAHLLRIPWSLTLHGISEIDGSAGTLLPDKIVRADFVACASWFMRAQAMRMTPATLWPKLQIVRCGVELPQARSARPRFGRSRLQFVTVGRIAAEKGHTILIEAFHALVRRGVNVELVIVGDGPLRSEVETAIDKLGLTARVTLLGALSEADALFAIERADIFVLPSLMEGLPVVLMEAMALGRPVIAPAVAGIPELVEEGKTGLLFPAGHTACLADQMNRLAGDSALRDFLASNGRPMIEREFSADAAVKPLAQMLIRQREAAGTRHGGPPDPKNLAETPIVR